MEYGELMGGLLIRITVIFHSQDVISLNVIPKDVISQDVISQNVIS